MGIYAIVGVVALAMLAGSYVGGFYRGWSATKQKWDAERVEQQLAIAKAHEENLQLREKQAKVSEELATALSTERVKIRTVTKTIVKEVPRYVTVEADRNCVVPTGFVQHHDAAASGATLPERPTGVVDSPSGVALSTVATTISEAYGICREWRAQIISWQQWYVLQREAWQEREKKQ